MRIVSDYFNPMTPAINDFLNRKNARSLIKPLKQKKGGELIQENSPSEYGELFFERFDLF